MTLEQTLSLVRPHLISLQPYSSARDEFDQSQVDKESFVYLDANENPFNTAHNRYPDPYQHELKDKIATIKGVDVDKIFIGNGSDEAIDLIIRLFCESGESILIPYPTYGMYKVSADINNVRVKQTLLDEDFHLTDEASTQYAKVFFLCSPNNPSGNLLNINSIIENFEGVIVVDEAYIDFTQNKSWVEQLDRYPNLIVLQTLSKAWGLAGLRLGMAFAHPKIIALLNKIKPPYNISSATQQLAMAALAQPGQMKQQVTSILQERKRLAQELTKLKPVKKVFPSEANFLLVRIDRAGQVYQKLISDHVVVRDRSSVRRCEDCLRITVGTPEENDRLITALKQSS